MEPTGYRISVDCGGTFTDGILVGDSHQVWAAKADSTPNDPKVGVMDCISLLAAQVGVTLPELLASTKTMVLGTTLATNIVATRTGAKTGAITTRGYRDRLSFLHVAKSDLGGDRKATAAELFSFRSDYPRPLAPRRLVTEVDERLDHTGEVLIPLRDDEVRQAVAYLKAGGVEAIAVNLLFSHLNPVHELRVEQIIIEEYPEAYVALSSRVLPVVGEVGRWSTTMFSAYVAPKITEFVRGISAALAAAGFRGALSFMQSNGGVATGEVVCENPAALLISGPAAGPALGVSLGRTHGVSDIVTADMGGTSFDISIIPDARINVSQKKIIDGKKYALPAVDVNAIGAGGGSIAFIDVSGRLQVGPASAGAVPGPACYGLGGAEPTVTDANLVLGYLNPSYFLGGARTLRRDLAEAAIKAKVAGPLGLSVPEAAAAIHDVVNAKMAGAIAVMFSQRGCDPRDFTFIAAGGAAPVHVARLTREAGMKDFVVPRMAPVFCAFGMMHADLKHNHTRPYVAQAEAADFERINELFAEMETEARRTLDREGAAQADVTIERSMDIHYYGQVREQNASVPDGPVTPETLASTVDRFHERHRRVIGYSEPGYPTVIVRLHLAGLARTAPPPRQQIQPGSGDLTAAVKEQRPAYFAEAGGFSDVPVYDGERLGAGDIITGPCIIEERMTTLVLPPGETVTVDPEGSFTTISSLPKRASDTPGTTRIAAGATAGAAPRGAGFDPTTLSVVWNRLESLLDESGEKVLHATQSYVLALVRDFGLSWLNPQGEIVVAAAYVARHIFSAAHAAGKMIEPFGGDFAPGDLIIGNDPYLVQSGHLSDWAFLRPVFYHGELFGFFQFRGHMADTGGFLPGGYGPKAYDIIAEGLNIPPLKVIKGGVVDKDLWALVCRNVRNSNQVDMDTMLINGALGQAETQVVKLLDKYGAETVRTCMGEMLASAERAARAEIAAMPDGTYHGESAGDWDGMTDVPVWVRVDMTVKGDELTFDFHGSDPQVTFVNSPLGNTKSICMESFYAFIDPMAPKNQGSFRPVRVIAPEGSVVNPRYPATVGAGQISVGEPIMEACKIALAQALPERATGGFSRHACPINVGMDLDEIDPRTGTVKQYMAETFASDGSGGAMKGFDGWPGVGPGSFLGSFVRPDIEHFESEVPFRVTRYEFMTDAEGAGEYRGGPGIFVEMVSEVKPGHPSFLMTGNCDGAVVPAIGSTGEPLAKLEIWVESPDGTTRTLRTMANEPVFPGEVVLTRSPGGGGWGDPLDRDPRKVWEDVADGLVTPGRAREAYGVIVDPATLESLDEATDRLRAERKALRAGPPPAVSPGDASPEER